MGEKRSAGSESMQRKFHTAARALTGDDFFCLISLGAIGAGGPVASRRSVYALIDPIIVHVK
jgi:hypothetical protein